MSLTGRTFILKSSITIYLDSFDVSKNSGDKTFFVCNDVPYSSFSGWRVNYTSYMGYSTASWSTVRTYQNGWVDESYRTITFVAEPTDITGFTNQAGFEEWLGAWADEELPPQKYMTDEDELTSIANAIRTKGGISAQLVFPSGFASAIQAISTGTDVSDTTATAGDVRTGKYFYTSEGIKTEGSIADGSVTTPNTTIMANPSISVNNSGLITATVNAEQSITPTVVAGYISSATAGTVTVSGSNTHQLTTQTAQTITPGTTDKTIASGKYLTGTQTIKGDSNLKPSNIAKDISIFGIAGTVVNANILVRNDAITDYTGNVTRIPPYALCSKASLQTVNAPVCTTIDKNAFYGCIRLSTASFPTCQSIGTMAFGYCYNLLSLYLLGSSVVTLANKNAFIQTPISTRTSSTGGVNGSVYVPASLLTAYKADAIWSFYSNRLVGV